MAQYINKDALLAEIERKKEEEVNYDDDSKSFASYADHVYYLALDSMQDFIDTLEVKRVDLDEEIKRFTMSKELYETKSPVRTIAKHFFELGLKAQKGDKDE